MTHGPSLILFDIKSNGSNLTWFVADDPCLGEITGSDWHVHIVSQRFVPCHNAQKSINLVNDKN
jgi:hypothetical protein